jgi:hypothetical protein
MKKSEALDRIVEAIELMADYSREMRDIQVQMSAGMAEQVAAFLRQCEESRENNALVAANNREEEKLMAERRERQRAQWAEDDARMEKRREMFAKYDKEDSAREKKPSPAAPIAAEKGVVSRSEIDAALMNARIDTTLENLGLGKP